MRREAWTKLHNFENKHQAATRTRFDGRAAQQSYQVKLARFVSWKINPEEFFATREKLVIRRSRRLSRKRGWRVNQAMKYHRPAPGLEPLITFGWGQSNAWAAGHTASTQTSLAEACAVNGATVLMLNEKGTSTTCGCRLPNLDLVQAPPAAAMFHQVQSLQIRPHRCTEEGHRRVRTRRPGHAHRKQDFCALAHEGDEEYLLRSNHAPMADRWSDYHRLQACPSEQCNVAGAQNQAILDPHYLRYRLPAGAPLVHGQHSRIFNRDVNSACCMRFLLRHYMRYPGRTPPWNIGAGQAQVEIPQAVWQAYVPPNPNNPPSFSRTHVNDEHG